MATSGSYDYSLTAADIINAAAEDLVLFPAGESIDSDDQTTMLRTLNLLTKQWMGTADMAPGLKVFGRKRIYLFLQGSQSTYSIGPAASDAHATETYYQTTIDAAEASGQTVISVASTANMVTGDNIGIEQDNGTIHWSTVSSFVANDTVTIAVALTAAAASGRVVYYYTTKAQRFVDLEAVTLREETDGSSDIPLYVYRSVEEYEGLPDKSSQSDPTAVMFEQQRITSRIILDSEPSDLTNVLRLTVLYPTEDYDSTTNDIAYPVQWLAALEWELAKRCAPKFEKQWTQVMEANWKQAIEIARQVDPMNTMAYFMPGRD